MLRIPAPHSLVHVLILMCTVNRASNISIDDALCSVVHFQCGTQMCIIPMHAQLSA